MLLGERSTDHGASPATSDCLNQCDTIPAEKSQKKSFPKGQRQKQKSEEKLNHSEQAFPKPESMEWKSRPRKEPQTRFRCRSTSSRSRNPSSTKVLRSDTFGSRRVKFSTLRMPSTVPNVNKHKYDKTETATHSRNERKFLRCRILTETSAVRRRLLR